jgi:hypothetical protein
MPNLPEDSLYNLTNQGVDAIFDEHINAAVNESVLRGVNVTAALAAMHRPEAIELAKNAGMSDAHLKVAKKSSDDKVGLVHYIATDAVKEGYFDALEALATQKLEEKKLQNTGMSL